MEEREGKERKGRAGAEVNERKGNQREEEKRKGKKGIEVGRRK